MALEDRTTRLAKLAQVRDRLDAYPVLRDFITSIHDEITEREHLSEVLVDVADSLGIPVNDDGNPPDVEIDLTVRLWRTTNGVTIVSFRNPRLVT